MGQNQLIYATLSITHFMTIQDLNNMDQRELRELLYRCCGSRSWSKMMLTHFPTEDMIELLDNAEEVWNECSEEEWKEAFSQHPRIGDLESLKAKFDDGPAGEEQASVKNASGEVLENLASANEEYEKKFGYIFIVCASGKSPEEMLDLLRRRMNNQPATEIRIAADEQMKITRLRLEKMLQS
jgi:2-oxo-4-hydroxy-4-carboxy-5-ureidoimidazoline decarboxylase